MVPEEPEWVRRITNLDLRTYLYDLRRQLREAERLIYVPGILKCAKCGCVLVTTNLHVNSGQVSANNDPQKCPNGCGPMWRRTERDAGNELCDRLEEIQRALLEGKKRAEAAERRPSAEEVREACLAFCNPGSATDDISDDFHRGYMTAKRHVAAAIRSLDLSKVGGEEGK